MSLKCIETELPGVLIFEPEVFGDARGFFQELFHAGKYGEHGLNAPFVQDNLSRSAQGVLRGLHYQWPQPQGKLVTALRGRIFDVAADIRRGSPTFGRWVGVELSEENRRQLWVPPGFAHGFCVVSATADVLYKCTALYSPGHDRGILWSDETLNIAWPVEQPTLSAKDARNPRLAEAPPATLPVRAR